MKREIIVCLILCLFTSIGIEAKKKKLADNVYWEVTEDGTLMISGYGKMPSWEKPWKKRYVRKIVVEEGITELGYNVFGSLSSLEVVSLPSTLQDVNGAFSDNFRQIKRLILNNCTKLEYTALTTFVGDHQYYLHKEQEGGELFYRIKYDSDCCGVVHSSGTWIIPLHTVGGQVRGCRIIDGNYYCIMEEKNKEYHYSLWSNGKKIIDSKMFLNFIGGKYVSSHELDKYSHSIYSVMDIKANVIIPMDREYRKVSYDVASNTFICHRPGYKYKLNESGKEIGIQEVLYEDYEIREMGNYGKVDKVVVDGTNYWCNL